MLGPLKPKIEKMKSLKSAALNPKSKKRKVKKEKDSPMLLMRAPPPPRGYSVRRVLDLSKPKVGKSTDQGSTDTRRTTVPGPSGSNPSVRF